MQSYEITHPPCSEFDMLQREKDKSAYLFLTITITNYRMVTRRGAKVNVVQLLDAVNVSVIVNVTRLQEKVGSLLFKFKRVCIFAMRIA